MHNASTLLGVSRVWPASKAAEKLMIVGIKQVIYWQAGGGKPSRPAEKVRVVNTPCGLQTASLEDGEANATVLAVAEGSKFNGGQEFIDLIKMDKPIDGRDPVGDFLRSSYRIGSNPLPHLRKVFGGKWEFSSDIESTGRGSEHDAHSNGWDVNGGHVHFWP